MAKSRLVNTRFWDDAYIDGLDPDEKLVFLYLLTNPLTNIAGVYELSEKRAAFDTGLKRNRIRSVFEKFEADDKVIREKSWIGIVNFVRYQSLNPKVCRGITIELEKAPPSLVDRLSIDYSKLTKGSDRLSHSNSNLNSKFNSNSKAGLFKTFSTDLPEDLVEKRNQVVRKLRF